MERITFDVHLGAKELREILENDARTGLTSSPKFIPSKYFYDQKGSKLFDEITRLPEYYLTRAERSILERYSDEIVRRCGADTLVEIGSGTSDKTRLLLDAFWNSGRLDRFIPFDVDESTLRSAALGLVSSYPDLRVHGVVGDFEENLHQLPKEGKRLIAFIGSTIGNLDALGRMKFLEQLAGNMAPGDYFLVGIDLVKERATLEVAYNDSAGITAEFNRNILDVLNNSLDGDFAPDRFEHVAFFDQDNSWIEMRLRSRQQQEVRIAAIDLELNLSSGEEIRTEISCKFTIEQVEGELQRSGLMPLEWWLDDNGRFALGLSAKP
ncbi:MAG TPA: L-histidine N(alpha)-methyltransferase [Actinomycetota bacterium]|nr:L-histidine N(alpha)-methyltransferase [Actinomycetota bacterium]